LKKVTIGGFPTNLDFDVIINKLEPFGKIEGNISWGKHYCQGNYVHGYENRIVNFNMKIERDIPLFFKLTNNLTVKVNYENQKPVCFKCFSPDHNKKDVN